MKIKAFFACQGTNRGSKGEYNIQTAGMTKLTLDKPLTGTLNAEIPLFIMIQREPNDLEGPHKVLISLFVADEQPKRQEFEISFAKEDAIASVVGSFSLPIKGGMCFRFELSLPGTSELMDWPFQIEGPKS